MLSRVIAKNIEDVFFETQCTWHLLSNSSISPPELLSLTLVVLVQQQHSPSTLVKGVSHLLTIIRVIEVIN